MAVIGHAEIVVSAITKNFEKQLKQSMGSINKNTSSRAGRAIGDGFADGFNRSRANNMFGKLSDGLRSMVPEAEMARKRFQSLVRTGYTLSAVLGIVAGAVSSVVVSIGPLIASLLKASQSAAVFLNILTTLQVAMRVGKAAFGDIGSAVSQAIKPTNGLGKSMAQLRREFKRLQFDAEDAALSVSRAELELQKAIQEAARVQDLAPNSLIRREAELAVEEAELALRRAKRESKDLNKDVNKGPQALQTGGGSDPFAELNEFQRKFAEYLVSLNPKFKELQKRLSKAFLPPLQRAVEILMKEIFPILSKRLPAVAKVAGEAMEGIAIQISGPENAAKIDQILTDMLPNIKIIGGIFGNILDIILSIVTATDDLAKKFLTSVKEKTDEWVKALNLGLEDGSLEKFFNDAGIEAAKWGQVIKNVFDGFGNLIKLTTGPGSAGEEMLNWFTEASAEFKNMFAEDPDAGKRFFRDAMINARAVLGAIGDFIMAILGVADNPNIKVTFDTLAKGAPAFEEMLDKMIDAAPSFAELVVSLIEIANILTDSKQISAFFDTLNIGAKEFKTFLESPLAKALLDNLGPLFATLSAFGVLFDVLKFGFQVLVGYLAFFFASASGAFKPILDVVQKLGGGMKILGTALRFAGWIGVIISVIAIFTDLYNKFEDFREIVDQTVAGVGEAFNGLITELMALFGTLFGGEGIGGIMSFLEPVIKNVLGVIVPFIGGVIEFVINTVSTAVRFITSLVKSIFDVIRPIMAGIKAIFEGDVLGGLVAIVMGIINIIVGLVQGIINGVISIINGFLGFVNGIISSIANSGPGIAAKKAGFDVGNLKIGMIPLLDMTGAISRNVTSWLNKRSSVTKAPSGFRGADAAERASIRGMELGGTVFPSDGGTIVRVAEAGKPERIEPLAPNGLSERDMALITELSGGGSPTINVYPSAGMDERELAELVSRRIAFEVRKGAF